MCSTHQHVSVYKKGHQDLQLHSTRENTATACCSTVYFFMKEGPAINIFSLKRQEQPPVEKRWVKEQ
eukprot:c2655_g1_i1 orf=167-367(-)